MKQKIYLLLCILTCFAFVTACGKEESVSGQGASAPADSSTEAVKMEENSEEDTEDTYVPDDEIINPDAEDEPGDEDLDTDSDNEQSDVPIGDALDEDDDSDSDDSNSDDTDSNSDSNTTDAQNKVSENPDETFQGSGTFNGFVDSSSVEITMSDGSYQTFFVYDEDVLAQLQKLEEADNSPTIHFSYRGIDGQVNPEIISIQ